MKNNIAFALAGLIMGVNSLYGDTLEMIFYPQSDFSEAIIHTTYQGDKNKNYSFLFDKGFDTNRIIYVRPSSYTLAKTKESFTKLSFNNTDRYTYLQRAIKDEYLISDSSNGVKILISGGDCKDSTNCVINENILTINVPKGYGVKSYQALDHNLKPLSNPIWNQNGNSITLIAKNVKGVSAMMELERQKTPTALAKIITNTTPQNNTTKQPEQVAKVEPSIIKPEPTKPVTTQPVASVIEPQKIFKNYQIFDNSGVNLSSDGKIALDRWADEFKSSSYKSIRINSYTDNTPLVKLKPIYGTNEALSQHRAVLVMDYLVSRGIATSSVEAVGMGELNPIASNDTPEGRVENRRLELILSN